MTPESFYSKGVRMWYVRRNTSKKQIFFMFKATIFLGLYIAFLPAQHADTLWSEDFEGDFDASWHADHGTWEGGIPTSGPGSAYDGEKCAATVLNGNYTDYVDSRWIRHIYFKVPSKDQNPRLRFWHWFKFSSKDYGKVQIKTNNSEWKDISISYTGFSSVWTYAYIDLSAYADSTIQMAFYFHAQDDGWSGSDVSSGWYIDNVSVIYGDIIFYNPEGFELGIGDWNPEKGTWEIGKPTSGPDSAFMGLNCAATVLAGTYTDYVDSRLISPKFKIPTNNPRLRFWHWFKFSSKDYGKVQIKTNNGKWTDISISYTGFSSVWTYPSIDLKEYADSTIQVAFYFHAQDDGWSGSDVSWGWYIDNVEIISGDIVFNNPDNWENGLGDWAEEKGTWQIGIPQSGPDSAYSPSNYAATVLNGKYTDYVDSRLISPPLKVPPQDESPNLRFYHWYSFSSKDYGQVQAKVVGSTEWSDLENSKYTGSGGDIWTHPYIDLTPFGGQYIQIAFYFHAQDDGWSGSDVSWGWYIDDISIQPLPTNNPPFVSKSINDTTFQEDNGLHLITEDLNTIFSDPNGDELTFAASSDKADILPSIHGDSLFVTSSENYFGSGNVFVTATDPGGLLATDTFLVTITPVNDAPGAFNLLAPADKDTVDTLSMPIQFVWSQAENVDQDTIWYDLKIFNASIDTSITDLTDTTFTFHGESILKYNDSYQWTVTARDHYEYTPADTFLFYTPEATSIHYYGRAIPKRFALEQNYPNPFNPTTTIKYALPKAGKVKLEVFNLLGQKVAALVNSFKQAGYHQITFDGSNLASGVYVYRLSTDAGFMQTRKMILMR